MSNPVSTAVPKIDKRTAAEVKASLVDLLETYTAHPATPAPPYPFKPWKEYDAATREPTGASAALIGVFARFAEIIIERLNQVPEKNLLAFLDLLGAALQPPQPARAPITFTLAAGGAVDAQVPQGTQVAAPPPPGAKDPVVFETERPLSVTAVQLASVLTLDPEQDAYGDWSERLASPSPFPVFQGDRAFEHVLYLGDSQLLGYDEIKNLRVRITLAESLPEGTALDPREVRWEQWDGKQWTLLKPTVDPTGNLTKSGTIHFGDLPAMPETSVDGGKNRWLRCRLLTPITPSSVPLTGMVRASHVPSIKRIITAVHLERTVAEGIAPELGFTNGTPLDLGKELYPFGEKPKLYDTWFLASSEAFSKDRTASLSYSSARIELDVQLANPHLLAGPTSVRPSSDLELAWECWTGSIWKTVGISTAPRWFRLLELDPFPSIKLGVERVASVVVQGTALAGAGVTGRRVQPNPETSPTDLPVDADGRFAHDWTLSSNGVYVLEFVATYPGRDPEKTWAVISHGETPDIQLAVTSPAPVDTPAVKLAVEVRGEDASQVQLLRVSNGNTKVPVPPPQPPGAALPISLAEGRNDLLIEALKDGKVLAAVTTRVSRIAPAPAADAAGFSDGSFALSQSGVVTLRLPETMAKTAVNGEENFWLRARLVKGDYGKEATYVLKDPVNPQEGFTLVPASFRPPIVAAIRIGYELTPRRPPEVCLTYNKLDFTDCTAAAAGSATAFSPFVASSEVQQPGLYLGFALPPGHATFPNTTISLYIRAAASKYGERAVPLAPETSARVGAADSSVTHSFVVTNSGTQRENFDVALLGYQWPTEVPESVTVEAGKTAELAVKVGIPASKQAGEFDRVFLRIRRHSEPDRIYGAILTTGVDRLAKPEPAGVAWQYWDGTRWSKLTAQDDSDNFTRSGLLEFLAPADLSVRELFGRTGHWLRVTWDKGVYAVPPRLDRMLLNTTLALQTTTITKEILGSSNGAERQQFRSTRSPILAGQQLEVREPEMPSAEEQAALLDEEGSNVISLVTDATGKPREIWVRWHEVPDFYASGPRDRHYTINHVTGEIRFGDGANGRVPPSGTGNLRLARYQSGGGGSGNLAAGAIAQLKTTVPYVEKAANPDAASGGAEAETGAALVDRMPRTLRHRDRAVTLEDYGDLALLASTKVARALCVPLRDLEADPLGNAQQPGAVSVIIVPRTQETKPLPTLELLGRVADFLGERATATASVAVVGPLYIRVDVRTEVALTAPGGASTVEAAVSARLAAFLHPLTGGLDGNGWDFGRAPHRSDFHALIESVPGVDHVRYLQITEVEDQPRVRATGRFLVYSGLHQIALVFEET